MTYYYQSSAVSWRDWDEWTETYNLLYSEDESQIAIGCAKVSAWESKQSIPIAIEVTAIMQRELHQTRNPYALALGIIRFINGVIEPFKNVNLAAPISTIGASCGVPDFLVDLRHSATHGRLPSFEFLKIGAESALGYLKENYWELQLNQIKEIKEKISDSLVHYFLTGEDTFSSFPSDIILSFGVKALINLALNPLQNLQTLSLPFEQKLCEFILEKAKVYQQFPAELSMRLAEEVCHGHPIAAKWLEFLIQSNAAPLKSIALILKWADKNTIRNAKPEQLLELLEENSQNSEPGAWPPTSIGRMPTGAKDLRLRPDQYIFVDPIEEEPKSESHEVKEENELHTESSEVAETKGKIEIW